MEPTERLESAASAVAQALGTGGRRNLRVMGMRPALATPSSDAAGITSRSPCRLCNCTPASFQHPCGLQAQRAAIWTRWTWRHCRQCCAHGHHDPRRRQRPDTEPLPAPARPVRRTDAHQLFPQPTTRRRTGRTSHPVELHDGVCERRCGQVRVPPPDVHHQEQLGFSPSVPTEVVSTQEEPTGADRVAAASKPRRVLRL